MISFLTLAILALAAYRVTRFLLFDTIIDGSRQRWYVFLANRKHPAILWVKLFDLSSCSWCLGAHVSWFLLALYLRTWPWDLGVNGWLSAFAVMGIQGLLHTIEPEEEPHDH